MTTQEFIQKQKKKIQEVKAKALGIAAIDTHRQMANRIFNEGEATSGSLIGNYNTTKPLYVNPKNSPKAFKTGGKLGKRKSVDGRAIKAKTGFFYSYRDFKRTIGQPTDRVRLNLFGRMQSDFVTGIKKVSDLEYIVKFKNGVNLLKARGQEKHFGKKIFSLSKDERELFQRTLQQEIRRILSA